MSLIEKSMETFVVMNKIRVADGEGGFTTQWKPGAEFKASATFDSSMQARVAESQGVESLYTITTPKNAILNFHDIIKRVSDSKVFRITSDGNDKLTPTSAMFGQYSQVTAEVWELTND